MLGLFAEVHEEVAGLLGGPGQVRTARLSPLQDGELVAQDQDLCGLPCPLTQGQPKPRGYPRDEKEGEPQAHDR